MRTYPDISLTQPIEDVLRRGHPWIFADAVADRGDLAAGDVVDVVSATGEFVGRGLIEPGSPIRVRLWTLRRGVDLDRQLLEARIRAALKRRRFPTDTTTGFRLLNGEGDRVPGLVCDVYANCAVFRVDGRAAERWLGPAQRVVERLLDVEYVAVRRSELYRDEKPAAEWLSKPSPEAIEFLEHGLRFVVDPIQGQKTGFFLDQRANRRRIAEVSRGRRLLNLFGYTGGFSVAAAAAGAAFTTTVDIAAPAIEQARRHFELNGLPSPAHQFEVSDVFDFLDAFATASAPWDVVVCDPPSFAHRRDDVAKASDAYVRLFSKVLDIMPTGSRVALASCSSQIDRGRFLELVARAQVEAGVSLVLAGVFGADVDHTILPAFPEGDYLQFALGTVARD